MNELTSETVKDSTIEQLRDWLAIGDGWKRDPKTGVWFDQFDAAHVSDFGHGQFHPFPHTLDGAARAFPEGWTVFITLSLSVVTGDPLVVAECQRDGYDNIIVQEPEEIGARYRLAVLAWLAMEEGA